MRVIDQLRRANAAPMVDRSALPGWAAATLAVLGTACIATSLFLALAVVAGGLPARVIPYNLLLIPIGTALGAWGRRMAKKAGARRERA